MSDRKSAFELLEDCHVAIGENYFGFHFDQPIDSASMADLARQMIAAPDLLEVLEALADEIDVIVYEDNIVGPESLGKARAALAKARGGEQ